MALQFFSWSVGGSFSVKKDNFPGTTAVETVCGTGSKSVVVTNKNDHTTSCTDGFCHN